ncbi:MAG: ABC transporter ATP-binding protein [Candidatus Thorarchaeota archaeon]
MKLKKKKIENEKIVEDDGKYTPNPDSMIQVFDLSKVYHMGEVEVRAIDGISMKIKKGEFVSVMGPSGSGKTTLLNMIGALDNPTSGAVFIDGINVAHMDDEQQTNLRLRNVGFIFQFYNLVPVLTAYENVELPLVLDDLSEDLRRERVSKFLELVGLGDRMDHLPSELSGGEQQRVAVARSLANKPSLLIADEPTGELDTKMGREIVKLLHDLNKELNQTILMVTHDPAIGNLADRLLKMRDGKIIDDIDLKIKTTPKTKRLKLKEKKEIVQPESKIEAKKQIYVLNNPGTKIEVGNQQYTCFVHKGKISGVIYVCPNCHKFYCVKCISILKAKGEKCLSCNAEITI